MNNSDIYPAERPKKTAPKKNSPSRVLVKELAEKDRHRISRHFCALSESDRILRFGHKLSDQLIQEYVSKIDFSRDKIFGVISAHFHLVGVGHLAFAPRDPEDTISDKEHIAEFGVSVSEKARGKGIGAKLFERGAIHCRNADVDTLYMHCLTSNKTMIHIAQKAGMDIHREFGETDAYLKLRPADAASVLKEAVEEQVAALDYSIKANTKAALKIFSFFSRKKSR